MHLVPAALLAAAPTQRALPIPTAPVELVARATFIAVKAVVIGVDAAILEVLRVRAHDFVEILVLPRARPPARLWVWLGVHARELELLLLRIVAFVAGDVAALFHHSKHGAKTLQKRGFISKLQRNVTLYGHSTITNSTKELANPLLIKAVSAYHTTVLILLIGKFNSSYRKTKLHIIFAPCFE